MNKKILFINAGMPDYLQDLTFSGLVNVLGMDRIVEFPWKPGYHFPLKTYPRNLGLVPRATFQGLMASSGRTPITII